MSVNKSISMHIAHGDDSDQSLEVPITAAPEFSDEVIVPNLMNDFNGLACITIVIVAALILICLICCLVARAYRLWCNGSRRRSNAGNYRLYDRVAPHHYRQRTNRFSIRIPRIVISRSDSKELPRVGLCSTGEKPRRYDGYQVSLGGSGPKGGMVTIPAPENLPGKINSPDKKFPEQESVQPPKIAEI